MAKVLLVEDDTNLSEIYQARLEAEGYIVVAAPDGETALALAAKEKPDLIISDVMMPKISGFEMLDILRNTDGLKHTKVIMLTALGQAEDKARAEQLGADRYLVKSQVTLEDIVNAAQTLLTQDDVLPIAAHLTEPSPSITQSFSPVPPLAAAQPVVMPLATAPSTNAANVADTVAATVIPNLVPILPAPTGPLQPSEPVAPAAVSSPNPVQQPYTQPYVQPYEPALAAQPVAPLPAETVTTVETVEVSAADVLPPDPLPLAPLPWPLPGPPMTEQVETQSTTQEAAAVQAKITSYENQQPPQSQQPQPLAVQTDGLPASDPVAVIDESVVANAIDKLLAKSPQAQATTDTTPSNAPDNDERQSKKVIAPLPQAAAPSLQELLAKEEAKSRPGFDPNNVAL